jgi:hypothetical protein
VVQVKMAALTRSLRLVWGKPGTRLGMWSHFTAQFPVTVFGLVLSRLVSRFPFYRSYLVLAVVGAVVAVWTVVLLCPGRPRCGCWSSSPA